MEHFVSPSMHSQRKERPPLLIEAGHHIIRKFVTLRHQFAEQFVAVDAVISNNTGEEIVVGTKRFFVNKQLPDHGFRVHGAGVEAPLIAHAVIDIVMYLSTHHPLSDQLS